MLLGAGGSVLFPVLAASLTVARCLVLDNGRETCANSEESSPERSRINAQEDDSGGNHGVPRRMGVLSPASETSGWRNTRPAR